MTDILDAAQQTSGPTPLAPAASSPPQDNPTSSTVPPETSTSGEINKSPADSDVMDALLSAGQPSSPPITPDTPKEESESSAVAPPPPKKKGINLGRGVIFSVLLLFFVTLPLIAYYASQQRQIAEMRSKASTIPGPGGVYASPIGGINTLGQQDCYNKCMYNSDGSTTGNTPTECNAACRYVAPPPPSLPGPFVAFKDLNPQAWGNLLNLGYTSCVINYIASNHKPSDAQSICNKSYNEINQQGIQFPDIPQFDIPNDPILMARNVGNYALCVGNDVANNSMNKTQAMNDCQKELTNKQPIPIPSVPIPDLPLSAIPGVTDLARAEYLYCVGTAVTGFDYNLENANNKCNHLLKNPELPQGPDNPLPNILKNAQYGSCVVQGILNDKSLPQSQQECSGNLTPGAGGTAAVTTGAPVPTCTCVAGYWEGSSCGLAVGTACTATPTSPGPFCSCVAGYWEGTGCGLAAGQTCVTTPPPFIRGTHSCVQDCVNAGNGSGECNALCKPVNPGSLANGFTCERNSDCASGLCEGTKGVCWPVPTISPNNCTGPQPTCSVGTAPSCVLNYWHCVVVSTPTTEIPGVTISGCNVTNNSGSTITVASFSGGCEGRMDGYCGPTWGQINAGTNGANQPITLDSGKSANVCSTPNVSCGSWQTDISINNAEKGTAASNGVNTNGCSGGGGTPPPGGGTQPPSGGQCKNIQVYKNGTLLTTAGLAGLKSGDNVNISVIGTGATKGRIRVNGGAWTESSTLDANGGYTVPFTIPPATTNFTFEGDLFIGGAWQ